MKSLFKHAAIALAAGGMVAAAPASATIFEYEMSNGDVMTIDNETGQTTQKYPQQGYPSHRPSGQPSLSQHAKTDRKSTRLNSSHL